MCSLILSFDPRDPWPVVIAANRDERLDRPWDAPAQHWPDRPGVIAGRDRLAGGTWLGLNRHGVMAALLNRTGSLGPAPGKASRGALPLIALGHQTAAAAAQAIGRLDASDYRSFNMVITDAMGGYLLRGLESGRPDARPIEPGITMVTASDPNDLFSPRIARYKPQFEAARRPSPDADSWSGWTTLLADRSPPIDTALNIVPRNGFATICASLIGLSSARSVFRFAAGPPDRAPFAAVAVTAYSDASPSNAPSA